MDLPKRKPTRLKGYDYSTPGAYFITICTKDRKELLSKIIVGDDAHIVPQNNLSKIGLICERYINNINIKYENLTVDKYVIMLTELMLFSHSKKIKFSARKNSIIYSSSAVGDFNIQYKNPFSMNNE